MLLLTSNYGANKPNSTTKKVDVEALDIKGLIQKPQAYFILNRTNEVIEEKEDVFPLSERINKQLLDQIFEVE